MLRLQLETYWSAIEAELRQALRAPHPALANFYGMMQYHMGWTDSQFQPADAPTGKRLRPLFCLLACRAAGGDPMQALPAAAAIELVHNFSLIHDDIEDQSDTRRHRPTVWAIWGQPQAINVGDGMFSLAHLVMGRLTCVGVSPQLTSRATQILQETCLTLTEGQFLDMTFEERFEIDLDEYLWMIQDKTAALLGAATRIGALLAGADNETITAYREFGASTGMAFQIQDDILGVWGDEAHTGKPTGSDIRMRKKALPFVYAVGALRRAGRQDILERLRGLYAGSTVNEEDIPEVIRILELAGARTFCEEQAMLYQEQAMEHLQRAGTLASTDWEAVQCLRELALSLLGRQS